MDYRDFFEQAVSAADRKYPFSDDKTIIREVRERTRNMSSIKKESKARIFPAVAGAAAAIGVLGAGVFGLNYMYQNGIEPLKENGGAAYHESEPQPEIKDIMTAAGDRFVFGDVVAEIENVDYDGQFIRVKYTVEYTGEDPEENAWRELALIVDPNYYNSQLINSHGSMRDLKALSDRKVEKIYAGDFVLDKDETVTFELFANSPDLFEETEVLAGTYTITGIDKSESCYNISDKITFNSDLYGETELYSVDISAYGVNLHHSMNFRIDNDFSFIVRYRDGSQFELYDFKIVDCSTSSSYDKDYAYSFLEIEKGDPIDVNNIAAVIINGAEIPLNVYTGMELDDAAELLTKNSIGYEVIETTSADIPEGCVIRAEPEYGLLDEQPENVTVYMSAKKDILDATGDIIEFDGFTATIERVDFDGTFLRVCYTPSDYEESFGDPNTNIVIHSSEQSEEWNGKLICGGTQRDEDTHTIVASAYIDLDKGETLELVFGLYNGESSGRYTLTGTDMTENTVTVYDVGDVNTGDIRWLRLSPIGVVTAGSETFYFINPKYSVEIKYIDGSLLNLYPAGWSGGASGKTIEKHFGLETDDKITAFGLISSEPIDVKNVSAVVINGTEIPITTE